MRGKDRVLAVQIRLVQGIDTGRHRKRLQWQSSAAPIGRCVPKHPTRPVIFNVKESTGESFLC